MNKRILSLLLALALVLTAFPAAALPAVAAETAFTDVAADAYYAAPVAWAVDKGITNGMTETTFGPDSPCTRGHVVTFLWRALGKPAPTQTTHSFTDIAEAEYYYDAVLWAVEKGVTAGMSATTFEPASPCTRGQVVTFLWRAMGKPAPTQTTHNFTDVEAGQYYYEPMLWAVEKGITTGTSATTFEPQTTCNRGQVVTFLYRTPLEDAESTEPTQGTEATEATSCSHAYDDDTDATCNLCGEEREIAVAPLTVTRQPKTQVAALGKAVSFSVEVSGGKAPYRYQWQYIHNGIQEWLDITDWGDGNRSDTITITVQTMDAEGGGKYRCVITDAAGKSVTSVEAWVVAPMKITAQPVSAIAAYGEEASFYVGIEGGMAPLTYQWQGTYTDDSDSWSDLGSESWVQGYNDSCFYVTASESLFAKNWRFQCVIRDSLGQELITNPVSVLEDNSFGIKKQPEDVARATLGDTITFKVKASGEDLSYQWYSGSYSSSLDFTAKVLPSDTYKGINTDTLSFTLTEKTLKLEYFCRIYDSEGNQTGTQSVKVLNVTRTLAIRTQPVNAPKVYSDDTPVTFTVEAVGEDLTYQWYRCYYKTKPEDDAILDPVDYTHATGAKTNRLTCNAGPIDRDDGYGVYCKITDKYGSVVYTDLVFSNVDAIYFAYGSPANVENAKVGDKASFTAVTYGGTGSYTYQWQYLEDGVWEDYSGTDGAKETLTITVTEKDFVRKIRCIVTDSLDNQITSKEVSVVPKEPTVIAQPEDVQAELEEQISFSVEVAGGKAPYTYQWQYKARTGTEWKDINGATQSTMTCWVQEYRYHNEYRCVIKDDDENSVISRTVRVDRVPLTIRTQPVSQTGKEGDTLYYTVEVAGGKAPYKYQWYSQSKSGPLIESKNSTATYTFEVNEMTLLQEYFIFYCVITDADGNSIETEHVDFRPAKS